MARRRIILQFISFSLNFFFLLHILNSFSRREKPNGFHLIYSHTFEGNNESYSWERMPCRNGEPVFKITQRGQYFVLNNYVRSSKMFRWNESITYVTHADYRHLENLIALTERWDGPVSVAVYAPGSDFPRALASIIHLRTCGSLKLRQLVTFHVYFRNWNFPLEIPPPRKVDAANADCDAAPPYAPLRGNFVRRSRNAFPYPINVGRNVARENALTRYLLVSDIELFPTPGLVEKFLKFLNATVQIGQRVYTLPVFEIQARTKIPGNKTELVKMLRAGTAQIFHKRICSRCHRIPKFVKWLEAKDDNGLNVFHVAKRAHDLADWEPIYFGTNDEPFYDERLVWDGKRDKMLQGYIMCLLDYEFHILDNAFLVHKPGIKRKENNPQREYIVEKTAAKIQSVILPQLKTLYGDRDGCKF